MKKVHYILLLAGMGFLASCAKEVLLESEGASGAKGEKTTLSVGLPATKTYMGELSGTTRKVYWSNGDQIAVNGASSAALSGLADKTSTTAFDFDAALNPPFNILYPASVYADASHVTLPASQVGRAGGFNDGQLPMAGYSSNGADITLSHLCAVVKVSVNASTNLSVLNSVTFQGRNNEKVSGTFSITYTGTPSLGSATGSTAEEKAVSVHHMQSVVSGTPNIFYIVVPARSYTKGFTLTVNAGSQSASWSKTTSTTLAAGHLYEIDDVINFIGEQAASGDLNIGSAAELIAFAAAYNNKEIGGNSDFIINLTSDISFDAGTSASFNATGGIGLKNKLWGATEDYYFNGVFLGNGHSISGLDATVPLFAATGSGGTVQDLNISDDCSFTFTHPNTVEMDAGAVVGYHKGTMENINVAAGLTLTSGSVSQVTAVGGVVGRVTQGTVSNCNFSGDITLPAEFSVSSKLTHIGGIAGSITNAAGIVQYCNFDGTLETQARVASTDRNVPYLRIGGIVGSNLTGTVKNCVTSDHPKEVTMANDKTYSGTLINHSTLAYHLAQGGICGFSSGAVYNYTNNASIQNFVLTTGSSGTASDSNSRYYDVGGIIGLNDEDASVYGCINNAFIESRSTPRIQKIGGIAGYNKGSVESCVNASTGTIFLSTTNISPFSVRVGEVGGVIGNNGGTVSDVQNAAYIHLDRAENADGVELKFGGVIGLTTTDIDGGDTKNISNTGNILDEYNGRPVTTAGLRFGGVVGSAQASVKNATNAGSVTVQLSSTNIMSKLQMGGIVGELNDTTSVAREISGCVNSGEVYFNANAQNVAHTDNYVGGILGKTLKGVLAGPTNVAISNCSNSGYIHGGNPSKQNGTTMYVGGIVAFLDGVSSISDCSNTGKLLNDQFNNTNTKVGSTFEGGIAGFVEGTSDNRITITDVTNDITVIKDDQPSKVISGGRRGYTGGAVGYGEYVDITNASNTNSYGGGSGYWYGGIAGWLVNSTVSGSTYSGTAIESSQVQGAGGIVCTLDTGTTINNCYSYLTTITHGANACVDGAIAAKSVTGTTISNCHYKSGLSFSICSDTKCTRTGNVADL